MSAESDQTDPYQKRLAKLEENLKTLDLGDTAYDIVKKALKSKPLTMHDEWEIHEKLVSGGQESAKFKERLKEGFTPLAINKAFSYSYLNIPIIELIEPLIESLDFAANSIVEVVDHPARLSFVMEEVVARRMAILLDELKIDLIAPQELQEMISSGRKEEAEQIMSTLDAFEKMVLEKYLNAELSADIPGEHVGLYEQAYQSALKKLRRPKAL